MTSKKIKQIAGDKTILISGEHGTGKRYLAHEIYEARSKKGTYVLLDGLSATHAEVEAVLFGRITDTVRATSGRNPAKLADYSTLCIANVDSLGPQEQDLLATFLKKQRANHAGLQVILTVGDMKKLGFDIGSFTRMNILPLRERPEDLPDLVKSILHMYGKASLRVSDNQIRVLEKSSWPGNIRELARVIGKGALVSNGSDLELPDDYLNEHQHLQDAIENIVAGRVFELDKTLWLLEKLLIERLLVATRNNQSHASAAITLSEANFRYRLKKFGIPAVRERT
jgi:DNA-binding NtrC family response regulator